MMVSEFSLNSLMFYFLFLIKHENCSQIETSQSLDEAGFQFRVCYRAS